MDIIQTILFFVILLFILSIAYMVYKIVSNKMEEKRKIVEILIKTEEGKNYLEDRNNKTKTLVKKLLPFIYVLFIIIMLIGIGGTIYAIKHFIEKRFENITSDDLKLLFYPGMSIYFILFTHRFIKNNTKNSA